MARPSNPTARVLRILDFLAENPTDRFGVSDLARRLGINKATCLTILSTLVDAGYVHQHPTYRDYSVGPSFVGAGHAAMARFADLADLIPSMRDTSDELDLPVVAFTDSRDQLVVLLGVHSSDPLHGIMRAGAQVPFVPPYGAALVDLSDFAATEAYLRRAVPELDRAQRDRLLASLQTGSERGFFVSTALPPDHELSARYEQLVTQARTTDYELYRDLQQARMSDLGYFVDQLDPAQRYHVSSVSCSVPRIANRPALGLYIPITGPPMPGHQVTAIGRRLVAAAAEVAARASGSRRHRDAAVPESVDSSADARQELVAVLRTLAGAGYGVSDGHVSVRDRDDDTFLISPSSIPWHRVRVRDIVRVDTGLRVVEPSSGHASALAPSARLNIARHRGAGFPRWVVQGRPPYTAVWAVAGATPPPLGPATPELAVIASGPDGDLEQAIAAAGAEVILLVHGGTLIAAADAGTALGRALAVEDRCRLGYHVDAIGRAPAPAAGTSEAPRSADLIAAALADVRIADPAALEM